ncbi:MAG: hypothetical protein ACNA8K_14325 [Cyclonatronaceae bacterium]
MIRLRHYALSLLAGCLVLFIPLVRDLHIESALLAAVAGCLIAVIHAARSHRSTDLRRVGGLVTVVYTAGFPLLIYALLVGCYSFHGLGFWIFYPSFSILFGYSITRYFRITGFRRPALWGYTIILAVGLGGFILELYTLPQVYFHNHVWGGWPGPIYDEDVRLGTSVIFFRSITLSWVVLLWVFPDIKNSRIHLFLAGAMIINLALSYTRLAENGVISPREWIQGELGGYHATDHFDIYYDPAAYTGEELMVIAAWHEFHLADLTASLGIDPDYRSNRIESYLYAHPWQKKKMTGAKFTSYVPVWQNTDQMHIAKPAITPSLRHELVHVVAKQFGNRLLNASWSIGLVEGLAVALDVRRNGIATTDQLVASSKPYPDAAGMRSAFSVTGFYGGRSSVNYTTSGSFVRFLLNEYPGESFREAYRTGRIEHAYSASMEELVARWHEFLDTVEYDDTQREAAEALFAVPSIFEKPCPHLVTKAFRNFDNYRLHLSEGDTLTALASLETAMRLQPENDRLWSTWTYHKLTAALFEDVYKSDIRSYSNYAPLRLQQADALILAAKYEEAEQLLQVVLTDTTLSGRSVQSGAAQRADMTDWEKRLRAVYRFNELSAVQALDHGNDIALLYFRQLLVNGSYNSIIEQQHIAERLEFHPAYTDVFLDLLVLYAAEGFCDSSLRLFNHIETGRLNEIQKKHVEMTGRFLQFNSCVAK